MTAEVSQFQSQEREFVINNFRVAAQVSGAEHQRPLLFFHGWLDNVGSFRKIMAGLPNHYCIALDFPGHGFSQHFPDGVSYHFTDLLAFMDDAVDHFGGGPMDIVGHSLGGAAATLFAASRPEKVKTLTLIDSLGPLTDKIQNTTTRLREYLETRKATQRKSRKFATMDDAITFRVKSSVIPTSPGAAEEIVKRGTRQTADGIEWTHDPRVKWPSAYRMSEDQIHLVIGDLVCPVLLIRANPGVGLSGEQWQRRIDRIKNVRQHDIQGSHHIHIDEAPQVIEWMEQFLRDHP